VRRRPPRKGAPLGCFWPGATCAWPQPGLGRPPCRATASVTGVYRFDPAETGRQRIKFSGAAVGISGREACANSSKAGRRRQPLLWCCTVDPVALAAQARPPDPARALVAWNRKWSRPGGKRDRKGRTPLQAAGRESARGLDQLLVPPYPQPGRAIPYRVYGPSLAPLQATVEEGAATLTPPGAQRACGSDAAVQALGAELPGEGGQRR